jgi:Tat protein secretion system quality control protein TatD with DNase activity
MPLKKIISAITGQKEQAVQKVSEPTTPSTQLSDLFPIYRPAEVEMSKYRKLPLTSIATLGAALSQMPESARSIVQTVSHEIATRETLFVGINPKGVMGYLRQNEFGTVGNIMRINEQGKHVIAGRMRFKALEGGLPINTTSTTTIPFDPTTLMIAVALMNIEQKLADLQRLAEEILQFLKLDKQSKQRGNLNTLGEILEDYKSHPGNTEFLRLRNVEVQTIKREAQQDILFYQERIAKELKEQKLIHVAQQAQGMLDAIMSEFHEYQLACYLYSFSSYLDIMLHKNFDAAMLDTITQRMKEHASRYHELYQQCRKQIENYYQASIDVQILGGIGNLAKALGNAIATVPVLKDSPVDELLNNAGQSLSDGNETTLQKKLAQFSPMEDSRIKPFIDNIQAVRLLYNQPKAMLTDGEFLYVLKDE